MKITAKKYAQALAIMLDTAEKTIVGNFFEVLRQRHQLRLLPKILQAFEAEWCRRRGITRVDVSYPQSFEDSLTELEQRLRDKLGDKIIIKKAPSDTLIGGFRVRIEDTLIDASVSGMLADLQKRLSR